MFHGFEVRVAVWLQYFGLGGIGRELDVIILEFCFKVSSDGGKKKLKEYVKDWL